jgi:P27 family predicted phage terminase small subunit
MGSRGPIGNKRSTAARTASGQRLARLPADSAAIFRRLVRDLENVTPADAAMVEDAARWIAIAANAYSELIDTSLLVTDTAHGDKSESRKNPLLIILRTASEQMRADLRELGATPQARARLPASEPQQLTLADLLFADVPHE